MLLPDALLYLQTLLRTGALHADYLRTVELRDLYMALSTGVGLGKYLRRYEARESVEEFEKGRLRLTEFITPPIWASLQRPFQAVARLREGVAIRYDYATGDQERQARELQQVLSTYYDAAPLEDYLSEQLTPLWLDTDPNAWLLTDFRPFDYRVERAKPYPVVFPCDAVVAFTETAGVHDSLTVRVVVGTGHRYTLYLANEAIDAWPVQWNGTQMDSTLPAGVEADGVFTDEQGKATHQFRILRHNAGRLPAKRIGYVPDKLTAGRTCVSHLDAAVVYLRKTLKLGSEADITAAQVVHPHKAQYMMACPGAPGDLCTLGHNRDGGLCSNCGGSGIAPTQTGSGDIVQLPYPKDAEPKDIVDLSKLVVWNRPPSDIVELQYKILDSFEEKTHLSVFNTNILLKASMSNTATEFQGRKDGLNATLHPFSANHSSLYVHHALVSAAYSDLSIGLTVTHRNPKQLTELSEQELYVALKAAKDAGADSFVVEEISLQIARKLYLDNPQALQRYVTRVRLMPFMGQSDEQVLKLYALGKVSEQDFTLRFQMDSILFEVTEAEGPQWFNYAYKRQWALVEPEIQKLLQKLPATVPGTASGTFAPFTPSRSATTPAPATAGTAYPVGTRVQVRPGMEHKMDGMIMGGAGTVEVISPTPALGIRLDEMPDEVHKWYVDSEVQPETK